MSMLARLAKRSTFGTRSSRRFCSLNCASKQEEVKLVCNVLSTKLKERSMEDIFQGLSTSDVRALGMAAVSKHYSKDFAEAFQAFDTDQDGKVSRGEFKRFLRSECDSPSADTEPPSTRQLLLFGLNSAIPFVVFGALDNSIMIVGGDMVDDLIGSTFKLSTLACAALANTFADVVGISIGNTVESATSRMGLPQAELSQQQSQLPMVRRLGIFSGSAGIFVGCIFGMTPLLFKQADKDGKS
mmetsp:Transcript_33761/g.61187  ORF Transcript_33761/g.61187 Transcript_33761/m.61187 type:complete len:242 (+) Transcript_33761:48-773(+)